MRGLLVFVIGIAVEGFAEGLHGFFALRGGDFSRFHGGLGEAAETSFEVFGIVFDVAEDVGNGVSFDFMGEGELAVLDRDGDDVGVAKEVVEVAKSLLVGSC